MLAAVRPILAGSMLLPALPLGPASRPYATLDRRGGPRRDGGEVVVDRFTAASHRPLPVLFAVGALGHWALMTGLTISPQGVLLRALDPADAALESPARDVRAAWRRLGARMGAAASPLWFSTACVRASAFVLALTGRARTELAVTLVPLDDRSLLAGRTLRGRLTALVDPAPDVLGVTLDDDDRRVLALAVRTGSPASAPAACVSDVTAPAGPGVPPAPRAPRKPRGRRSATPGARTRPVDPTK